MAMSRWIGRSALYPALSLLLPLTAFAGTAELVIAPTGGLNPPNLSAGPGVDAGEAASATSTDVISTSTAFYAFRRYPGKTWYSLTPWNGQEMQGVAVFDDYGLTIWWIVYGIWDHDGIEDWEARLTRPDGSFDGIHWHTEMRTVNGVYEKCFVSSDPETHQERGQFCKDDPTYGKQTGTNTILFGLTHAFWSDSTIEVRAANLTHNGVEIWTTPWLLGDLRLLNPNPGISYYSLIDSSGHVTSSLQKISTAFTPIPSYVAADGITPLLFRVGSTAEIPVTLKIKSGSTGDGILSDFYGGQTGTVSVSPSMQLAPNNNYYGVGLYTAPPEFSPVASSAFSRVVQLEADFEVPWQGYPAVLSVPFQLIHRPLVMIHGIWSNPTEAWSLLAASPAVCGSRICVAVDWSPADTPLPNNVKYVWNTTRSLMIGLRQANVAITQADVIAHSAGAPLFRLYRQSVFGNRQDNFFMGDFRKLLSFGGVHHGTAIADFVQQLLASADPVVVKLVQLGFAALGKNTFNGIIGDLRTVSPTMQSIRPTAGYAHAWIGDLPSLENSSIEKFLWRILADVCALPLSKSYAQCQGITLSGSELLRSRVFNGQVNDGLVARDVQSGGTIFNAQTTQSNTPHTRETEVAHPAEVAWLLDVTSEIVDAGGFR
jgi:hypothetical protein